MCTFKKPTRKKSFIPYGKQWIEDDDIQSVLDVLQSDWLTTGPKIEEFEQVFADFVGVKYAVAVISGTAALHSAMFALNVQPGDEVIVPAMTFVATVNCVVFQGGTPIFSDVDPDTLLIDLSNVNRKINKNTKAIIAVDYAGQPCDYDALRETADKFNLTLVADACHAIGGRYKGKSVGSLAKLNTFSFHPVKHITTGEGGMITTDDLELAQRMRNFRNHGITTTHWQRHKQGSWFYEMFDLGYNYRITDFQSAMGMSQLKKLPKWVRRRQEIAHRYNEAFSNSKFIKPLNVSKDASHAYHLYVVRIAFDRLKINRTQLFAQLKEKGIGVNVHYIPVYLHPYYRKNFDTRVGLCPNAESAYEEILSLPIFPKMTDNDVTFVIDKVIEVLKI